MKLGVQKTWIEHGVCSCPFGVGGVGAAAAIANGERPAPDRCGQFHGLPSRVGSNWCGTIRWADRPAVDSAYTAALGNWALASRPVRAVGGVYTGVERRRSAGRKVRRMVTVDLLSRARAGDGEAFRELAESHLRELQVHCYRMLGSLQDAEDAVQETMLAAWQGIGGFTEERASLRTWLYKIATNRCLNARRAASRRPAREWDMSQFEAPVPTPRDE